MKTNVTRSVLKWLLTALLLPALLTAPVYAQQSTPGSGRDSAGAPLTNWVEVPAKSTHWYKFNYDYNSSDDDSSDDENKPSQAVVELRTQTTNCPKFEVWSIRDLNFPRLDDHDKPQPTGRGTPLVIDTDIDEDGDTIYTTLPNLLVWAGGSATSETFYVVVKNSGDKSCSYQLKVAGPDIHF